MKKITRSIMSWVLAALLVAPGSGNARIKNTLTGNQMEVTSLSSMISMAFPATVQSITKPVGSSGCSVTVSAQEFLQGTPDAGETYSINNPGPFGIGVHNVTITKTATTSSGFLGIPTTTTSTYNVLLNVVDNTSPVAVAKNATIAIGANGQASIFTPGPAVTLFTENWSSDNAGYYNSNQGTGQTTNWWVTGDIDMSNFNSTIPGKEIDLAGFANAQIETKTTFTFLPGTYTFSFQHITNLVGGANVNGVQVIIGSLFNQVFNSTGSVQTANANFTVTSTTTATIKMIQTGTSDAAGSFVGNISLTGNQFNLAIENGSIDNCGIASLAASKTTFNCTNLGQNTVTLTAIDNSGNSHFTTAIVTVIDPNSVCNQPPVANGKNMIVGTNNGCTAAVAASDVNDGSTDPNGDVLTYSLSPAGPFAVGVHNVTFTATDPLGASSTDNVTITVFDNVNPTIAAPTTYNVYLDANGQGSMSVANVDQGSFDNCALNPGTLSQTSFSCGDVHIPQNGQLTGYLTADNEFTAYISTSPTVQGTQIGFGNNWSQPFAVNTTLTAGTTYYLHVKAIDYGLIEMFMGNLNITGDFVFSNGGQTLTTNTTDWVVSSTGFGVSTGTPLSVGFNGVTPWGNVTNISNASQAIWSTPHNTNGGDTRYFTTVITPVNNAIPVLYSISDINGNSASQLISVSVIDNIAPSLSVQNYTVALGANGQAAITTNDVVSASSDNCGVTGITLSQSNFTCANLGANNVTVTATDAAGNATTQTAIVTVVDNQNPSVTANNVTVNLDANQSASVSLANLLGSATDNCGAPTVTLSGQTTYGCGDVGATFNVTVTATDASGNTSSATATVTVADPNSNCNQPPVAVCQNTTLLASMSGCSVTLTGAELDGGSSDPDGDALTYTLDNYGPFGLGTHNITMTVSDGQYSSSCSAVLTVIDGFNPQAVCQDVTIQLDANGLASIFTPGPATTIFTEDWSTDTQGYYANTTTNNWIVTGDIDRANYIPGMPGIEIDLSGFANGAIETKQTFNFAPGVYTFSFQHVTNTAGGLQTNGVNLVIGNLVNQQFNSTTSIQTESYTFTVASPTSATIKMIQTGTSDPGGSFVGSISLTGAEYVLAIAGNSTDNCGIASVSASQTTFDCTNLGTNNVTLTVTDNSGNTNSCVAVVTVEDNIAPAVSFNSQVINITPSRTATVTAADVVGSVSDNCGTPTLTLIGQTSFDCDDVGQTFSLTLVATDAAGNATSATGTVTIADNNLNCNRPPVAVAQNVIVGTTGCVGVVTAADVDNGSYDPDNDVLTYTLSPAGPYAVGVTNVTLTVEDPLGEISSANATVTVFDNENPTIVAPTAYNVYLDANGQAGLAISDIDNGTSDNCAIANMTLSQTSFTCADGPNGADGNLTGYLTVDNYFTAYISTSPTTLGTPIGSGNNWALPFAVNSNLAAGTTYYLHVVGTDIGGPEMLMGNLSINGNFQFSNGGQTLTTNTTDWVVSTTGVGINTVSPIAVGFNGVSPWGNVANISNSAQAIWTNDYNTSGGETRYFTTVISPIVNTNPVLFEVTDVNGNVSSQIINVTVLDTIAPSIATQNVTVNLDANGQASVSVADVVTSTGDNCAVASTTLSQMNFDCSMVGNNTITATVVDENGNSTSTTAVVTVVDNTQPAVAVQNISINLDANGQASISVADVVTSTSDNCGVATVDLSNMSFDCSNTGANTVTVTVVDVNGNVSTANATVTVLDVDAPTMSCPGDISVVAQPNDCSPSISWNAPVVSDNCSFTVTSSHQPGDNFNLGTTVVTYTATDASGNQTVCTFSVTVTPTPLVSNGVAATYIGGNNVSCFGAADGSIDLTTSGGCEPYSYNWSNGQTTEDATGLAAGNYSVLVTDGSGQSVSMSFVLTEPTPLTGGMAMTPYILVAGQQDSTIFLGYGQQSVDLSAAGMGGTAPYTYSWAPAAGLSSTTGSLVTASPTVTTTYVVTVTDANNCTYDMALTVKVMDVRDPNNPNKIMLCHKTGTGSNISYFQLSVNINAVPSHLAHGDYFGNCPATNNGNNTAGGGSNNGGGNNGGGNNGGGRGGKGGNCKVDPTQAEVHDFHTTIFPNPTSSVSTLELDMVVSGEIRVVLINSRGEMVKTLFEGQVEEAEHFHIDVDSENLSNGIYHIVVNNGDQVQNVRWMIMK